MKVADFEVSLKIAFVHIDYVMMDAVPNLVEPFANVIVDISSVAGKKLVGALTCQNNLKLQLAGSFSDPIERYSNAGLHGVSLFNQVQHAGECLEYILLTV